MALVVGMVGGGDGVGKPARRQTCDVVTVSFVVVVLLLLLLLSTVHIPSVVVEMVAETLAPDTVVTVMVYTKSMNRNKQASSLP